MDPTFDTRPDDTVVALLAAQHDVFLRFLKKRVERPQDAEEILQTAFVKSLVRTDTLRTQDKAIAWFYRILRNAIIDHHRHQGVRHRAQEQMLRAFDDPRGPDEDLERVLCSCFEELVPTLSPSYAQILRRVDLGEESVATFAASEGLAVGNVRVRLHRARKALHKRLEQVCGTCTLHGCLDCDCQKDLPGD